MIAPGPLGAISAPNGAVPTPAGLAAVKYRFFCVLTWFSTTATPAIAGWTLVAEATDNRAFDRTSSALLFIDVADGSAAPADFTPTGITDWIGQIFTATGDFAATFAGATQGSQITATVQPGPVTADRDGAFLAMACGCWNFSAWQASGFGGSQIYPPGFVPTLGEGSTSELGGFYLDGIPEGAIDTTFGDDVERFAVVVAVFLPALEGGAGLMLGNPSLL